MGLFEHFPYTNFHDMNTDWLIKVAKEFMDKYETMQDTIDTATTGITELAETLEAQLNAWYTTHSADIANQLANSLTAISNALNSATSAIATDRNSAEMAIASARANSITDIQNTLADAKDDFDDHADEYGAEVIASLPPDYLNLVAEMQYDPYVVYPQHTKGVTGAMQYITKIMIGKRYNPPPTPAIVDDATSNILVFETGKGFITGEKNSGAGVAIINRASNAFVRYHNGTVNLASTESTNYLIVNESDMDYLDFDYITDGMPEYAKRTYEDIPVSNFSNASDVSGQLTGYGGTRKAFHPFRMNGTLNVTGADFAGLYNATTGVYDRMITTFPVTIEDEVVVIYATTPENVVIQVNDEGGGGTEGAVLYSESQNLTSLEKTQAKMNIGANFDNDINSLQTNVIELYGRMNTVEAESEYSKTAIDKYNTTDLLTDANHNTATLFGITYTWNQDRCMVTGTATATGVRDLMGTTTSIPNGFAPGQELHIKFSGTNVTLNIVEYVNGSVVENTNYSTDSIHVLRDDITGLRIGLRVANGKTVNETVEPHILNALTNEEITNQLDLIKQNNTFNLLYGKKFASGTTLGVTFTALSNGKWNISGTATANVRKVFYGATNSIPNEFVKGSDIYISFTGINVALSIADYKNGSNVSNTLIYSDYIYHIKDDIDGLELGLRVANGTTVNETVKPVINFAKTNTQITAQLGYTNNIVTDTEILNCAKTYLEATETGFTYGEKSAFDYTEESPKQIHCGCLNELIIGGCPYHQSRYITDNTENKLNTYAYGFDYYVYAKNLVKAGNTAEINYIQSMYPNLTVTEINAMTADEMKRLNLYKASFQQAKALDRWGMLFEIENSGTLETDKLKIGDIIFCGMDEEADESAMLNGYHIVHCDTVVAIRNGVVYVADGGAVPITIHPITWSPWDYHVAGRVPLSYVI